MGRWSGLRQRRTRAATFVVGACASKLRAPAEGVTLQEVRLSLAEGGEETSGDALAVQLPVAPGQWWRGIVELRQFQRGNLEAVAAGAMVRSVDARFKLSEGRHTVAFQCGKTWSVDAIFYWEGHERR